MLTASGRWFSIFWNQFFFGFKLGLLLVKWGSYLLKGSNNCDDASCCVFIALTRCNFKVLLCPGSWTSLLLALVILLTNITHFINTNFCLHQTFLGQDTLPLCMLQLKTAMRAQCIWVYLWAKNEGTCNKDHFPSFQVNIYSSWKKAQTLKCKTNARFNFLSEGHISFNRAYFCWHI